MSNPQSITTTYGGVFDLAEVQGTTGVSFTGSSATQDQYVYADVAHAGTGGYIIKLGTGHNNLVDFTGADSSVATNSVTATTGDNTVEVLGGGYNGTTAKDSYTISLGSGENDLVLGNAAGAFTVTNVTSFDTLDVSAVTTTFSAFSMTATSAAVATTNLTVNDIADFREVVVSQSTTSITGNALDDTFVFKGLAGAQTITGATTGTSNDTYQFYDYTGSGVTQTLSNKIGINVLDFTNAAGSVTVNFSGNDNGGTAYLIGQNASGSPTGHTETINFNNNSGATGAGGIADVLGGSGSDTFNFGTASGTHAVMGGTGNAALYYTGTGNVTINAANYEMQATNNLGAVTTDVTYHSVSTVGTSGNANMTYTGDGSGTASVVNGTGISTVDFQNSHLGGAAGGTVTNSHGGTLDLVLGAGYGTITAVDTNPNGVITADFSNDTLNQTTAITHVTLGAGAHTIDDGGTTTGGTGTDSAVTWAATSYVNGFIGNASTIAGVGAYNFHITDTDTASGVSITTGDGSSTINVGNSTSATVVAWNTHAGTGSNTINGGSGTDNISIDNTGNNYVYAGSNAAGGTSADTITVGAGNNLIDFSNGGYHILADGSATNAGQGANYIQGFSTSNNWHVVDNLAEATGSAGSLVAHGTLDMSNFAEANLTFEFTTASAGATGAAVDLIISNGTAQNVIIHNFFDGTTAGGAAAGVIGTGALASYAFSDDGGTPVTAAALLTYVGAHATYVAADPT